MSSRPWYFATLLATLDLSAVAESAVMAADDLVADSSCHPTIDGILFLSEAKQNWEDAKRFCSENGGDSCPWK